MKFKRLSEEFLDVEQELDLLTRTIDGVHFWERVRFPVHRQLAEQTTESGENKANNGDEGLREYLSGLWLFIRNTFSKNPYFAGESDILFFGTGRRKKVDEEYVDVYIDPLLDKFSWSYLCLERPYNIGHSRPAATDNLRYTDLVEYGGVLGETLGLGTIDLSADEDSLLREVASTFESKFGISLPLVDLVRSDLTSRRIKLGLYRRLIEQVDPRLVILVNSYNGRETFVEACQSAGVPVAELQHGVIHKYHMGYSFPGVDKSVFPDYFFSFGEFWSDIVDLPVSDENVYPIGYAHLEREFQEYTRHETKDQVVFVSQAYVGDQLSRLATNLAERTDFDSKIVYKLHPKEFDTWHDQYPWLLESPVEVIADDPALYRVFSESTAQIGVGSTALYEGLMFDLDTYIVTLPGHEYMEFLLENDFAVAVGSVEDFLQVYERTPDRIDTADQRYFFETDVVERFHDAIQGISNSNR